MGNPAAVFAQVEGERFRFNVPDPDDGGYRTLIDGVIKDGRVRVTRYSIASDDAGEPLPDDEVPDYVQKFVEMTVSMDLQRRLLPDVRYKPEIYDEDTARVGGMIYSQEILTKHQASIRRRNDWTTERLKELAEVYRKAQSEGVPPRQACAQHFQLSPNTISRAIRLARDGGFLDQPEGKSDDA